MERLRSGLLAVFSTILLANTSSAQDNSDLTYTSVTVDEYLNGDTEFRNSVLPDLNLLYSIVVFTEWELEGKLSDQGSATQAFIGCVGRQQQSWPQELQQKIWGVFEEALQETSNLGNGEKKIVAAWAHFRIAGCIQELEPNFVSGLPNQFGEF